MMVKVRSGCNKAVVTCAGVHEVRLTEAQPYDATRGDATASPTMPSASGSKFSPNPKCEACPHLMYIQPTVTKTIHSQQCRSKYCLPGSSGVGSSRPSRLGRRRL